MRYDQPKSTNGVDREANSERWVKAALAAEGRFNASQIVPQRLHYRLSDAEEPGYPIDIIPFRGVEQPPNAVAWPPEMTVLMSVTGYEEALAAAAEVQIDDNLVVPVISLPGLVVLKLFAWRDREAEDSQGCAGPRDAFSPILRRRQPGSALRRGERSAGSGRLPSGTGRVRTSWPRRAKNGRANNARADAFVV